MTTRRDDGEYNPTSMAGLVLKGEMGLAVRHELPRAAPPRAAAAGFDPAAYYSATEALAYTPSRAETAHVFDLMMEWVHARLGDALHEVVLLATDAVLEVLKGGGGGGGELTRQRRLVAELLAAAVPDEEFNEVWELLRRITDYERPLAAAEGAVAVVLADAEDDPDAAAEADAVAEASEEVGEADAEAEGEGEGAGDGGEGGAIDDDSSAVVRPPAAAAAPAVVALGDIDELFLQRRVAAAVGPDSAAATTTALYALMADPSVLVRQLENAAMEALEYAHFDLVRMCVANRWRIVFRTRLLRGEPRAVLARDMQQLGLDLEAEMFGAAPPLRKRPHEDDGGEAKKAAAGGVRRPRLVDLDAMTFDQGAHLMTTAKVTLPEGLYQQKRPLYDEITVPAPAPRADTDPLVPVLALPEWCRCAFPEASLNRIQLRVFARAFESDDSMLLCAPTGAGKTNVAMLAILRVLANHRDAAGALDMRFKCVYIAPLKALVQEQTRELQRRLTAFGVVVSELTGDALLSRQQIAETQVLVTTPEKWDVVTRRPDAAVARATRLVIIDEIHLLHDERGPVLESIVARTVRLAAPARLVGLLATLPNYRDVAAFLRVRDDAVFYFDALYRPCPLEQRFIGIKEKKAIKRVAAMNEACYDKVVEARRSGHQMIIFVHSRKDTFKTAKWLSERLAEASEKPAGPETAPGVAEVLRLEAAAMSAHLQQLVPLGFGIHHAGLSRPERLTVEDLFAQGHLRVLVSTATLAWGVNLPAHTVVIKGTETYLPERGAWVQLLPQDILQMLGRAGRPRYDRSGEGVIITLHDEVQYYLAVLNQQLPIELQMMLRLVDALNAEVASGAVRLLADAVAWMACTYLYVRMLRAPALYKVGPDYAADALLAHKREDLCHSALHCLAQHRLVLYDDGRVRPTELGRVALLYYLGYATVATFSARLKPWHSEADVVLVFAAAAEFSYIPVRQEEKMELAKLMQRCPLPVREAPTDPAAKVSVLLQAHVSRLALDGYALMADMVYVTQSAVRLLRAIYEIVLQRRWLGLAQVALGLCKMVEHRMWMPSSPLRQLAAPRELVRAAETLHLPWRAYLTLAPLELAEALGVSAALAMRAHSLLQQFPKLSLRYSAQPVTSSWVRVHLEVLPEWSAALGAEDFLVLVEDCDGARVLAADALRVVRPSTVHHLDLAVEVPQPVAPVCYVTVVSQRWLHSQWRVAVVLDALRFPKPPLQPTELLDLQPVPLELGVLNRVQSQAAALLQSNNSVFVAAAKGWDITTCAELAVLHHWRQGKGRAVHVCPPEAVDALVRRWRALGNGHAVAKMEGDLARDVAVLGASHLTVATPQQFELVSRRWRQRKAVQLVELFVFDNAHAVGSGAAGAVYETLVSRMRFMAAHLGAPVRMVALAAPLAHYRDFAAWIGCVKPHVYNFDPSQRAHPLDEIRLQGALLDSAAIRTAHDYCRGFAVVFVPSRRHCVEVCLEWMALSDAPSVEVSLPLRDDLLRQALAGGVGYYYRGMHPGDRAVVDELVSARALRVVLATREACAFATAAPTVVVLLTTYYDGEHRHYAINEVLEMVGCARQRVLVLTPAAKVAYYQQFLAQGLPLESFMDAHLHNVFATEITTGTLRTRQDCIDWLTYTYFYRRLQINPSFYGVSDTSHLGLSEYLSDLVEDTLRELAEAGMVEVAEEEQEEAETETELSPLDGAIIAAYHNVLYPTMVALRGLSGRSRMRELLETLARADYDLGLREHDAAALKRLYARVPVKTELAPESAAFKAFVLLQAHFSRLAVPLDLAIDQRRVLERVLAVLGAMVDTLASEGHLNAMSAMDLSQMVVQGVWDRDSPLRQVPHFDEPQRMARCASHRVELVYDLMALDDDERDEVLQLEGAPLEAVAAFVNLYPNVDLSYALASQQVVRGEPALVVVTLQRDEEMETLEVQAAQFPLAKTEAWWVVVGDAATRQLYAIKRTTIAKELQLVTLDFTLPHAGRHRLSVWAVCDSYVDADKEVGFEVEAVPAA
jgi:pre-mRNA-splicing helicase BRR2